jgi:hypothetical protein
MRRIVVPGGYAVVTLPFMFRRETGSEHRYTRAALKDLFGEWDNVRVTNVGSAVSGAALYLGQMAAGLTRRWPVLGPLLPGGALIMNACGTAVEALLPRVVQRWPANAVIVAQRPRD